MARFSKSTKNKSVPNATNLANAPAYKQSSKLEIVSILFTSFAQDQFYRTAEDTFAQLESLILGQEDKEFVAKALLYARNDLGMRSITHVGISILAKHFKGQPWMKAFVSQMIRIPKDATETFAYYSKKYGPPFPNSLKRGVALVLPTFNEYQLAKNKGEKSEMSLIDVVNLCHPVYTPALNKLMKGELKQTDTWESKLSEAGSDEELKGQAWETLLTENKLGYLALLRNLRNISEQSPKSISMVVEQLTNPEKIKKSLVMPFQFIKAVEQVQDRKLIQGLNKALDISLSNVPKLQGKTLIALDNSGSMSDMPKDPRNKTRPIDHGSVFASILYKSNDSDLMLFNSDAHYLNPNPDDTTSTIIEKIKRADSGGTNFDPIFKRANKKYDRIVILSDMQAWESGSTPKRSFAEYKTKFGCDPILYSFDLAGYGTLQFPEKKVLCLAGFSDKIFEVMSKLEEDKDAMIHRIEQVKIEGVKKIQKEVKPKRIFSKNPQLS